MNNENPFGELFFSSSFQNELWVSLIEKAWAKINGCYANIDYGGFSYEVFDLLTEAYSEQINIEKVDEKDLWEILMVSEERKYLMAAASKKMHKFNFFKFLGKGLDEGHAYTVVKAIDIPKEKLKFVQLNNPYGDKVYNGD